MNSIERKLNVYFAALASLCGLTFAGSPNLDALPIIGIFFAIFGVIFVDLLRWFALPSVMSYVALALIAFFTITRFYSNGDFSPEPQMEAVAWLLVMVQSVLMLQRKSRRIYEQLAVFALLQLIVAAIFNNAVIYGVLLLPLGASLIVGLSLLHILSTSEEAFSDSDKASSRLRVHSSDSRESFFQAAALLPRIGWVTIAPSVMVIALVFFYALPRTNQQARHGIGGKAQVGFNTSVQLGQIGQMMLNPEIAVRLDVKERRTGRRYDIVGDFYIRGAALEHYGVDGRVSGSWSCVDAGPFMAPRQLPPAPNIRTANDRPLHDDLIVRMTVSPMDSQSLFSLPPYYFDLSGVDIVHQPDRWLISRRVKPLLNRNSQLTYRFATHGFRDGLQGAFVPRFAQSERLNNQPKIPSESESVSSFNEATPDSDPDPDAGLVDAMMIADEQRSANAYRDPCLVYDIDMVPSAARVAQTALGRMQKNQENPVEIARQMERFLSDGRTYQYTLDLTMQPIPGIDPVEQFLTVDREGNCQYFASALVLMLRSQGIPARLVVGFNTDEFNAIGGYHVARQLHAHAWVEALVEAKWVPPNDLYYASEPPSEYWMRLDPTPGGGGSNQSAGGRVSNVIDMAQDIWTNYVVDADAADRRRELGLANEGMSGSYQLYYEWMKLKISRVRAGELGAGALAGSEVFSWQSAVLAIVGLAAALVAYHFGRHLWLLRAGTGETSLAVVPVPKIAFFAETVALLESVGIRRRTGETPKEYTSSAAIRMKAVDSSSLDAPLTELTSAFYVERFGKTREFNEASVNRENRIKLALAKLRERITLLADAQVRQRPKK